MKKRNLKSLDQFRAGQSVVIREVQDDNPDRLRRWYALGLTPGAVVHFVSHQPLDDLYELRVGHQVIPLGSEGLAGLRGELVLPQQEELTIDH
jgi:DtxR family Mn-dependent transcriptional regulator